MRLAWLLAAALLPGLLVAGEMPLFFAACSDQGWACSELEGGAVDLDYTCGDAVGWNVIFRKESFVLPPSINSLKISECVKVTAVTDFVSMDQNYSLNGLILSNIQHLSFVEDYHATSPPRSIILEDIGLIPYLPPHIFAPSSWLWDSIVFQNVTIGQVASEAFVNVTLSTVFIWSFVHVEVLNASALNGIILPNGEFVLESCYFGKLDQYALQVHAANVTIRNSYIGEVWSHGIYAEADRFTFSRNSGLEPVMFRALEVRARETLIAGNRFGYLQVSALEGIGPLPGRAAYEFSGNAVREADPGSLHVDLLAYEGAGGTLSVEGNTFACSCDRLGWLGVLAAPGSHHRLLRDFHRALLDERSRNACASGCGLPLGVLARLVADPRLCAADLTGEQLCALHRDGTEPRAGAAVPLLAGWVALLAILRVCALPVC
ncbi:uncharacterized protein LOC134537862 isoform X1 [Bacillus rossius redtenbacheri]|uniref:uncharacterized protein LOC134537862 isoform X1 n=1 Tax=Bacillus rossius redtenbacheri TaxID=93214 RepID=UPI002FDE6D06